MTRAPIQQWPDKTGRAHPTLELALTADLAALLGSSFGTAEKIMSKRGDVMALLGEVPEAKVVAIGSGRKG